jgi:hypothetical protein
MPLVLVEKVEKLFKCRIRDMDMLAVQLLDLVLKEQPAVQVWDFTKKFVNLWGSTDCFLCKTFKEQRAEEVFIEAVFAFLFALVQPVYKIIIIVVKKALFLNEVDKHQTVEHH